MSAFAHLARAVRRGERLALRTWRDVPHKEWMCELGPAVTGGGRP